MFERIYLEENGRFVTHALILILLLNFNSIIELIKFSLKTLSKLIKIKGTSGLCQTGLTN